MGLCRRFDKGCLYRWRIGSLPCLVFSVSHFSWALPPEGEGAMFLLTSHARELPVLNSPCHMWFIIILLFLHPSLLYVLQPKHNLAFLRKMRTLSILVTLSALSRSFHFFCERCSVPCGARSTALLTKQESRAAASRAYWHQIWSPTSSKHSSQPSSWSPFSFPEIRFVSLRKFSVIVLIFSLKEKEINYFFSFFCPMSWNLRFTKIRFRVHSLC